jgi:hypothetical protein
MSVVASVVFLVSLAQFCYHTAHAWRNLDPQIRIDEVFLAGLFVGLMLQLWREKSKTAWMLMTTAAVAFVTATHLVYLVAPH